MVKLPPEKQESADNSDRQTRSEPFPASFESPCGWCDEQIYEGDPIVMLEGQALHERCAEEAE